VTTQRTPIIAGNWKMFKTVSESVAFVRELAPRLAAFDSVERVVCPSFVALHSVAEALRGTPIKVGAQNVAVKDEGAFTSQISPLMLQGLAEYVIIGHSECRQYLGETNEIVNAKVKAALARGLRPIVAVGESERVYDAGETETFVGDQVCRALDGVSAEAMAHIVIAYEPIWAIGTGKAATAEIAQHICGTVVRGMLQTLYGDAVAQATRVQYGGSVKPGNMAEYMAQPDVDGALVGGASLVVDDFARLVEIAAQTKGA
jgi:triosephosphate isomerase